MGGSSEEHREPATDAELTAQLQGMLRKLWASNRASIDERVHEMEKAVGKLNSDAEDAEARERGGSAAHKLAGVLGTFGLQEGTEIARKAEHSFCKTDRVSPSDIAELSFAVEALRSMIAAKHREAGESSQ